MKLYLFYRETLDAEGTRNFLRVDDMYDYGERVLWRNDLRINRQVLFYCILRLLLLGWATVGDTWEMEH